MTNQQGQDRTESDSTKLYAGGCHCGAVRFEVRLDLRAGLSKCNCSICRKTNCLGAKAKPRDFKLLAGAEVLADYQFNTKSVHHHFCRRCGVRPFGYANIPEAGGEYYTINVHCLDDADITGIPVRYSDGLNNNWWNEAPAFP